MPSAGRALAGALAVLLIGLVVVVPYLVRDRDLLTTTPMPESLIAIALVPVAGGSEACLDRATMDERSGQVRFQVATYRRAGPPLRVSISGPGYRDSERITGYRDNDVVAAAVRPPRSDLLVSVCVRNEGPRRVALFATETSASRSATRVDGAGIGPNIVVSFAEAKPASLLAHLPAMLERMAVFRPVGSGALWALALLFAVGIPGAVITAYVRAAAGVEAEDAAALAAGAPPHRPWRERVPLLARVGSMSQRAWLAAIIGVTFLLGAGYVLSLVEYFVMPDELGYVKQASHIASTFTPSTPGDMWFNSYGQLWSLLIAPIYGLLPTPAAFDVSHLLAAAAIASAAIPAYRLARRVIDGAAGPLFAAALTVAVPWLAFSGSLMTESLAYPLFAWALLACAIAVERPSPARDTIALAAIVLAFLARPQLAALAAAFAAAVVLHELTFTGDRRTPAALLRSHAVLLAAAVAGLAFVLAGVSSSTVLGNYSSVTSGGLFVDGMAQQGRELLAYVALGVAVLPLALAPAWIVLSLVRPRDRAAHAVAALSLATIVTMVVVTASFSVRFTAGINDRYLFFIAPLLTIGAVALLFDRRPAPLPLAAGAAFAAAVLGTSVLSAAGPSLVSPTYSINTVLQGRGRQITEDLGLGGLAAPDLLAIGVVAAVVVLAIVRLRRPGDVRVAIAVCAVLLLVSLLGTRYALNTIKGTQAGASPAFVDGRDWLDRAAPGDAPAGALLSFVDSDAVSTASWWDLSFWNKRLDRVWQLPDTNLYSQGFARAAAFDPRTGRIAALDERSLLVLGTADRRFALRGARTVAGSGPFALVRAPRPYRAVWTLQAARDDGLLTVGRPGRLTLFGDGRRPRRVRLRVSAVATADATRGYRLSLRTASGAEQTVRIASGARGTLRATVRVPANGRTRLTLTLRGARSTSAATAAPTTGVIVTPDAA